MSGDPCGSKGGGGGKSRAWTRIEKLVRALEPCRPERLYLFGSWARGEEDELSDIDLVVIKETPLPFFDRLREVTKFIPPEIGSVDILVYTPGEFAALLRDGNAFAQMIAEEGRLIYDRQAKG